MSLVDTDRPGHSLWSALVKAALSRIVPLDVSISLLKVSSVPSAKLCSPSEVRAVTSSGPALRPSVMPGRLFSGAVNTTAMGSIWAMETMPVALDALTMLPLSTSLKPTRPVMGARIVA